MQCLGKSPLNAFCYTGDMTFSSMRFYIFYDDHGSSSSEATGVDSDVEELPRQVLQLYCKKDMNVCWI